MLLLFLLSCLLTLGLVNGSLGHSHDHLHRLHHARRDLIKGQAEKPDDITAIGVQSASVSLNAPSNSGSVKTALETSGEPTVAPFATSQIPKVTATLSVAPIKGIDLVVQQTTAPKVVNIFDSPIGTGALPAGIGSRSDHPVPRLNIGNQKSPIGTNKFYAGFFLGSQSNAVWTHPYSLAWSKGNGNAKSWGISTSYIEAGQRIYGPDASANPVQYYINLLGIQHLIFSAKELNSSTKLTTDTLTDLSANVNLVPEGSSKPVITIPLVQGMGFVTATYNAVTPFIESSVYISKIIPFKSPKVGVTKYKVQLQNGKIWLLYATASNGTGLALNLTSPSRLKAPGPFAGTIQIARNPGDSAENEQKYDACAGAYVTGASVSGSVDGKYGSYSLSFKKAGNGSPLLMFALPHHVESMDTATAAGKTNLRLQTTTKGIATGIIGDFWRLVEPDLPSDIGFAPWSPTAGSTKWIPDAAKRAIDQAALQELSQDMEAQSNLNSMYFSGKALSKFATAIYAVHDLSGNVSLAKPALIKLQKAFSRFASNTQIFPLVYESAWGGVVSTATYVTGDAGVDFGNSYYNDHHFHWSYFIHTASIIGYLDPSWIPANKDWVNTLVRDCANPSAKDGKFPISRSFDWYHGHSWAKGLFDSADGKDEESSSEDALLAYAVKMWGKTSGDNAMEARGNLMLAVLRRSLHNYFLLESSNKNQPPAFLANKVTGILFENKIDHATYFGLNIEFIQGIHMLPILPLSAYTRSQTFVREEWARFFDNGRVDAVQGGWRGILYSNLALIDAKAAWRFFSDSVAFKPEYLDGGASLTWYLALAAGLGGAV